MKGGFYLLCTSLLTIGVVSSCALFILVVSEVLQDDSGLDLSGLHNVSKKASDTSERTTVPNDQLSTNKHERESGDVETTTKSNFEDNKMTLSLNSVTTDGLPDTGQPPILISLTETAKIELKNPDELLFTNDSEQHNDTKPLTVVDSGDAQEEKTEEKDTEPMLIVKAKPMHEVRVTDEAFQTNTVEAESQTEEPKEVTSENIPIKPETPQEDIPSFSEWAQKQLAEAEKKDTVQNHSSQPSHSNTNFSSKSTKIRSKNYASPACGAKVVAVNPEAGSASSILSPNRDEYMLNTCNSRIWFIIELCEAVQAQKIEIANFELFSSTPKDIAVYFSDRFPTRDWTSVGQFTAEDVRNVQSFDLFPHLFGKFIKVEMLSHHGSEHYCPISLFKVYGTSEFEVLEKESSQHVAQIDDDDEDEIIDVPDVPAAEAEPSKNLFGSARDAVMSIMKKAAQALVKSEVPKNVSSEQNDTNTDKMYKRCCSPSHLIVCDNCSETLYSDVYELISCSSDRLTNLLHQVFLRETLKCTEICQPFGLDFKSTKTIEFSRERVAYMNALFSKQYIAALCNLIAIQDKKVVLNTSFETESDETSNITLDESDMLSGETVVEQEVKTILDQYNGSDEKANESFHEEKEPTQDESDVPIQLEVPKEELTNIDEDKDKNDSVADDKTSQEPTEEIPKVNDLESLDKDNVNVNSDVKEQIKPKPETPTEKFKEPSVEEAPEQLNIDNDSFMSEFEQIAAEPTPPGTTTQSAAQQTILKESVFLRLSNRVKALERNMSLSGQYLEELSRRYKKQVEEMQKTFEKTILQMTEERKRSNEREQKYLEHITSLQDKLMFMGDSIKLLLDERDSWFGNVTFFKFIVFQTIIMTAVYYFVVKKRPKIEPILVPISKRSKKKQLKLRRKSLEGVSGHATPAAKKRRPSEEAMQITRESSEAVNDGDDGEWQVAKKNRRRKTSIVHRNIENERHNWGRQDSIGMPPDNPIPLDDDEYIAPVSEPLEFDGIPEVPKKDLSKVNGMFNNLKSKTMKTRRLSSPAFLRTFSRQSSRSNPSPVVKSLEPIFNGKVKKKSASESPTNSLWSASTEISQNGQANSDTGTKKRKSFKNILKKVF